MDDGRYVLPFVRMAWVALHRTKAGLMTTAAKRTMPVGLWVRLMARLSLVSMRLRIARLLVWLVKTLRL
jgi:hypothetical protein